MPLYKCFPSPNSFVYKYRVSGDVNYIWKYLWGLNKTGHERRVIIRYCISVMLQFLDMIDIDIDWAPVRAYNEVASLTIT